MKKFERRNYPITDMEVRAEDGKPTILRGYAAVFEKLSVPLYGFREKIRKGAFAKSIERNNIKALWNHNSDYPLGSTKAGTLKLEEDDRGLWFELELPDNSWGRDAAVAVRRKDVDGVSFGFEVEKEEWDNSNPKNVVRTLVEVNLIEISPTPFPAYPATSVSARSVLAEHGIDYDRLAGVLVRAEHKILTEEDYQFLRSTIEFLQNLTGNQAAKRSTASLRRRLELAEKMYL